MNSPNNPKYSFFTVGCRANQFQTESIKSELVSSDSTIVPFNQPADIYIINTCLVTLNAERTSLRTIRRALRQNPKAEIMIAGCLANLHGEKLKALFPQVKIYSPGKASKLPEIKSINAARIRENLMIEDGCENFCSYCIVPYARGKTRSKPLKQTLNEAKLLVAAGAKEIVLTGINLGAYGKDLLNISLSNVITAFAKINGLLRLRLSSIEPMYLARELVNTIADAPNVCHSLHIPLQSGDNNTLQAMNRKYSINEFIQLIEHIRNKIPDCGIGTDIIVGFPGETEKAFNNTAKLIKQLKFSRLHVFPYSKREVTSAALLPNQIDLSEIKERVAVLRKIGEGLTKDFAKKHLGKKIEVLIESKDVGLTSNFIRCRLKSQEKEIGTINNIRAKFVNNSGEILC
ncbi:MAG: MiaB/RimO family radical SAM methylthiotransferase [Candidatus Margulisbacteria bacterium]|nr:MiaB/RimO family radical SAM methylthiotransferase [Candidatus Margulisiibacteriota bacterium]